LEGFGEVTLPGSKIKLPDKIPRFASMPKGLKMVDVQPLIHKAASKLVPWCGKFIALAGRGTLTKSALRGGK
jgi:hypothetical protein